MKKKVILIDISILLVLTIIIVYTNKEEDTSLQDNNTKQVYIVMQEHQVKLIKSIAASSSLLGTDGDYSSSTFSLFIRVGM